MESKEIICFSNAMILSPMYPDASSSKSNLESIIKTMSIGKFNKHKTKSTKTFLEA